MDEPGYPFKWVDEVFSDGTHDSSEPEKSVGATTDTASTRGPDPSPSESGSREATGTTAADAAKAKLELIYSDKGHPFHRGDPIACDEVLALYRQIHPDTPEPELEPVTLTAADRPAFTLPTDVDANDPAIQALADTVAYAELPPHIAQPALDRVFTLMQQDIPESAEELDVQAERAIAAMQKRFGSEYQTRVTAMQQGRAILEAADPGFRTVFNDPRIANDPTIFVALSELGLRQRVYDSRRYGTSRSPRFA